MEHNDSQLYARDFQFYGSRVNFQIITVSIITVTTNQNRRTRGPFEYVDGISGQGRRCSAL